MRRFVGRVCEHPSKMSGCPQPSVSHSRQVLYRGYIANPEHIVQELKRRAIEPQGTGDASLFAAAHLLWGAGFTEHVLGEYAVAIYDSSTGSLLLTRDGLGVHPLFYASDKNGIAFASHLEELLRVVEPGALDEIYLGEKLLLAHWSFERTPFRNILNMVPGRSIVWSRGQLKTLAVWNLSHAKPVQYCRSSDYEERFRELLVAAVRQAIPNESKTWATLSGGLDSSSIVCAAKIAGIDNLETLSFVFTQSRSSDERPWMAAVVKKCGYVSHQIDSDQYPPFSEFPPTFYGAPNLIAPYSAFFRRYESLMAEHGVDVELSGGGGDHVLIGDMADPIHLADDLVGLKLGRLWSGLKDWQRNDQRRRSLRFLIGSFVVGPAARHWRGLPVTPRFTLPSLPWMHPRLMRKLSAVERQRDCPARARSPGDQYYLERVWDFSMMNAMNTNQIVRSFEYRYPLVYRPLVEFLYGVAWDQKLSWESDRYLQRRALRGILPEKVRLREDKLGPTQAVMDGFRRATKWIEMLRTPSTMAEMGLVDAEQWRDAVRRAEAGQIRALSFFLQGVVIECWLQQSQSRPKLQILESSLE